MKLETLLKLLKKYEDCIECEVFIDDVQTLDIISQGIKIDEIKIWG